MPNQSENDNSQRIQQSAQPALLVDLKRDRLLTCNTQCIDLLRLDSQQIAASEFYLQLLQQAHRLVKKGLQFFNYEILKDNQIILIIAEVREEYLVVYLQEKATSNMLSHHLISILDSLGAQVYCKDSNYRYTYANKEVSLLLGKKNKDLIGKSDRDLFENSNVNKIQDEIDQLVSGNIKSINKEETLFINKQNQARTFLSVKKPLYGKNKKVVGMFGISTDISQYKATENKLNTLLDNIPVYIYIKDLKQRFIYVNKMTQDLFQLPIEDILGKSAADLLGESNVDNYDELDLKLLETKKKVEGVEDRITDAKTYHYWTVKAPLFDDQGNLTSSVGMSTDITKSVELEKGFKKANKELKDKIKEITKLQETLWEQATQDPLTNLFNRRYFNEYSEKEIHKANRNKKPLALLLLDADYFKDVNDQFGHDIGDQVLIKLSRIMIGECRRTDIVCRYGGEEFVILMPDASEKTAFERAETIRLRYQKEISEFLDTPTTISVGIAMWNARLINLEGFTKAADLAMYQAKENGRNQVVIYNSKLIKK